MSTEISPLLSHAQRYVREVMERYLQENGFVSYKGQGMSWYRVVNHEVIQTLYFHTRRTWIPVTLEVGYGSHPLYISPIYPSGVYFRDPPVNFEIFRTGLILKIQPGVTNMDYSSEIQVVCPNDAYKGLDIIMGIVESMNQLHSAEDVYQMHKASYAGRGYRAASTDFFDEVIYNNDVALYEPCLEMINDKIVSKEQNANPTAKIAKMLKHLQLQRTAMETGDRDEILAILAKRREKNVKDLQRKVSLLHP